MTTCFDYCQRELPPACWHSIWIFLVSGSPFTVEYIEDEDIGSQPLPPQPTPIIQSAVILVPVTPLASGLLPSFSSFLTSSTNPEPVPKPTKDLKPEPIAEPEPAESVQVCELDTMSILELENEPVFIPELHLPWP